jgi:hypothetical protein
MTPNATPQRTVQWVTALPQRSNNLRHIASSPSREPPWASRMTSTLCGQQGLFTESGPRDRVRGWPDERYRPACARCERIAGRPWWPGDRVYRHVRVSSRNDAGCNDPQPLTVLRCNRATVRARTDEGAEGLIPLAEIEGLWTQTGDRP